MQEEALRWLEAHVTPAGPIELVHDKPWSRVWKVPLADDDAAWFKACAPVQDFEPQLTAALHRRWPERIVDVIAHDKERAWLLLADGGTPVGAYGNAQDAWAAALPVYAELQRGESVRVGEHLENGVTDRRLERLPELYEDMLARDLPLDADEIDGLRRFASAFGGLCTDLAARGIPETLQHDDLHIGNVYAKDGRMLILDWGDATISHAFFSLARTVDEWDGRLRAAYLEPWGSGLENTLDLALRVGRVAHTFGFLRLWDHLNEAEREQYPHALPRYLRRALASAA